MSRLVLTLGSGFAAKADLKFSFAAARCTRSTVRDVGSGGNRAVTVQL